MVKFKIFLFLIFSPIFIFSEEFPVSPYVNSEFIKKLPWGKISFYLQPWRSYMETYSGKNFLEGIGIVFNFPLNAEYETALKYLAECGFKNIRIEIPFSKVHWDESKLIGEENYINLFKVCKKYGVKPLILLNADPGYPCPMLHTKGEVLEDANVGLREIKIKVKEEIKEGYTSIIDTAYFPVDTFIVKYIKEENKAVLSRPLGSHLKKGDKVALRTFKYLPAHPVGTKEFEELANGWLKYVKLVCDTVKKAGLSDNEFELEIWNEGATAGKFMCGNSINFYYDPPKIQFPDGYDFSRPGGHAWEISKRTVDYVKENYPNARVIWGFSNTSFYHTPITDLPKKIDGQSYHIYGTEKRFIPKNFPPKHLYPKYIEGYVPENLIICMPEGKGHLGIIIEHLIHNLYPEYRIGDKPEDVNKFHHYMTEHGFSPPNAGITEDKAALEYKAKSLIRALLFWLNKGISKIYIYCAYVPPDNLHYGILPGNINAKEFSKYSFEEIATPAMKALKNIVDRFKDSEDLKDIRQLDIEVVSIGEQYKVFEGDQNHPPLYYRDMFTFLPFQTKNNKFICAYYVMSYDITNPPPPMNFKVKIKNIYGENSNVSFYDPIKDKELEFDIIEKDKNFVEVELEAVEYPRLIIIEEKAKPIFIEKFNILDIGKDYVVINVSTSVPSKISIDYSLYNWENRVISDSYLTKTNIKIGGLLSGQTYGFIITAEDKKGIKIVSPSFIWENKHSFETEEDPSSLLVGLKTEYYISEKEGEFSNLTKTEISPILFIDRGVLFRKTGKSDMIAVRYTGEIYIDKDDKYTFYTRADDGVRVKIDDTLVIDRYTRHFGIREDKGEIELKKGWHKILIEYFQYIHRAYFKFYYSRSDMEKREVPAIYFRSERF